MPEGHSEQLKKLSRIVFAIIATLSKKGVKSLVAE